jgi:hypothetical protein
MTGYEAFAIYQSLKLHFTQDSYDYFKYNGKTNISVNSFENRKDKYHFYKLARKISDKDELVFFMASNFVENENAWIGNLLQEDSEIVCRKHQKVLQSFSYIFENDCKLIFDSHLQNPNEVLMTTGDYPILLTMTLQKVIHIETLCVLNRLLNFFPMWSKNIQDTIRWPKFQQKVIKYSAFLPTDNTKHKLILKKVLKGD